MARPKTPEQVAELNALMRELLTYDPSTGVFVWKVKRRSVFAGDIAGSLDPAGYRIIAIAKKDYGAHNLAWLWMTGEWPAAEVDHKDLVKSNNAWLNLRAATRSQNCANKGVPANSILGIKGVGWSNGKYRARIYVNRKTVCLGGYDNIADASAAVKSAGVKYYGEFYNAV